MLVDHGNDIAAQIPHSEFNRVHPYEFACFYRAVLFRPSGLHRAFFYQPDFASGTEANGDHPHFIVSSGNDPSNG